MKSKKRKKGRKKKRASKREKKKENAPDRSRHGDHGRLHQPGDDRRQGSVGARNHDDDVRGSHRRQVVQDAVQAVHGDVSEPEGVAAHRVGHGPALLGHSLVGGAGGKHDDGAGEARLLAPARAHVREQLGRHVEGEPPRVLLAQGPADALESRGVHSRRQSQTVVGRQLFEDGGDLLWGLPRGPDDFRETRALRPPRVNGGEILDLLVARRELAHRGRSCLRGHCPGGDPLHELEDFWVDEDAGGGGSGGGFGGVGGVGSGVAGLGGDGDRGGARRGSCFFSHLCFFVSFLLCEFPRGRCRESGSRTKEEEAREARKREERTRSFSPLPNERPKKREGRHSRGALFLAINARTSCKKGRHRHCPRFLYERTHRDEDVRAATRWGATRLVEVHASLQEKRRDRAHFGAS